MHCTYGRTIVAGVLGGIAANVAMLITFRFTGFGITADGFLLDPSIQSRKLIAIWTEIEPLPLVVTGPASIIVGMIAFGIIHAYLYRWTSPAWSSGIMRHAPRLS